jgi:energy-coupling factor transporter ATP-binding protein EcfA2
MLTISDLSLRIAGRLLLDGASLSLPAGAKAGLVGRNGAGKTTLFRAITGDLAPEKGGISLPKNTRIGQVAQEAPGADEAANSEDAHAWSASRYTWTRILISLPKGSRTKKRRTPQGSSIGPYSIGMFAVSTRVSAASRSSTSIERSGTGAPEPPSDAKLT